MEIKITKIIIDNFRGISHLEKDLYDKLNIIQGYNGVGKTTVLSSITWCLFGKLYDDRSRNIPILPISSNVEEQKIETSVILHLNEKIVVKRTYDGENTDVYFGYIEEEGDYSLKKGTIGDMNEFIKNEFLDIDEFKLLSNLSYAVSLPWREMRDTVFAITGDTDIDEVFEIKEFPHIKNSLKLYGLDNYVIQLDKDVRTTIVNIKSEEIAINNLEQVMIKHKNDVGNAEELMKRRDDLQAQLISYEELIKENEKKQADIDEANKEVNDTMVLLKSYSNDLLTLERELFNSEKEFRKENSRGFYSKMEAIADQKDVINKIDIDIASIESSIEIKRDLLETARQEGNEIKRQEIVIKDNRCKTCGQLLPKEVTEKALQKLKLEQKEKLSKAKNTYDKCKREIIALKQQLDKYKITKEEEIDKLRTIEQTEYSNPALDIVTDEMVAVRNDIKERKVKTETRVKETELLLEQLRDKVKDMPQPEVLPSITLIQSELEEIAVKLQTLKTAEEIRRDIEEQQNNLANSKKDLEILTQRQRDVAEYRAIYSSIVKKKTGKYFKIAEFITEEYTKEGKLIETFKLSKDGVPYAELNTAMKIEVALDFINGLQLGKGIKVPVLVDNCESILDMPILDTQMLTAKCIEQKEHKLEIIEGEILNAKEKN